MMVGVSIHSVLEYSSIIPGLFQQYVGPTSSVYASYDREQIIVVCCLASFQNYMTYPAVRVYWVPKRQPTMTCNPSRKFTQKFENVMLITIVMRWNIDNSHGRDAVLAEAASSCCQSAVKSTSHSWHFFLPFLIMTNLLELLSVNKLDWLHKPPLFVLWDWSIPDEACVNYILKYGHHSHCITYMDFNNAFQNPEITKWFCHPKQKMMLCTVPDD